MFFKLEYTVRGLWLPAEAKLSFDFGNPHNRKVEFRCPSEQEQSQGHSTRDCVCTASSAYEPNPKVAAIFSQIDANQFPTGEDSNLEYPNDKGTRVRLPPLANFTENFRSFVESANAELSDIAIRTISVLHWRANVPGPFRRISTRGTRWSMDEVFWHPMPCNTQALLQVFRPIDDIHLYQAPVRELVANGGSEPIYHDLFREAWDHVSLKPRSALAIGIAACEIATKHCISTLVPDAEWLVTNLQSPPLLKMLVEYLPTLPGKCDFNGNIKPPPKHVIDDLKDGVSIRNSLVHAGADPTAAKVASILCSVRDVLWMVDYYCGSEWALDYLRLETRSALTSESSIKRP
jgi:hypothetical protein